MLRTITPKSNRVGGGTYLSHLPPTPVIGGGIEGVALTPGAPTAYGNQTIIATPAQVGPDDCWIEGIELYFATGSAVADVFCELTLATGPTGTAPPATATIETQVGAFLSIGAQRWTHSQYIPLRPPVYVPGGSQISGAAASTFLNIVYAKLQMSYRK